MSYSEYERLSQALRQELRLHPRTKQEYEISLTKTKIMTGIQRIRLSQAQKNALFEIYLKADSNGVQDVAKKTEKEPNQ